MARFAKLDYKWLPERGGGVMTDKKPETYYSEHKITVQRLPDIVADIIEINKDVVFQNRLLIDFLTSDKGVEYSWEIPKPSEGEGVKEDDADAGEDQP